MQKQVSFLKREAKTHEIPRVFRTKILTDFRYLCYFRIILKQRWSYLNNHKWRFSECCIFGRIPKMVSTMHLIWIINKAYNCTIVLIISNGWVTKHANIPLENPHNSLITGVTLVSSINDNWYLKLCISNKTCICYNFIFKGKNMALTYKSLGKDPKMAHHEVWLEQAPSRVLEIIT